jgi:hypothetical protein
MMLLSFRALLVQIPEDETIVGGGRDGVADTKKCDTVIAERDATAVTFVRRNGGPWKKYGAG